MNHTALRRIAAGAALTALTLAGATGVAQAKPGGEPPPQAGRRPVLAFNDFHGNLEPPSGLRPAAPHVGGAEVDVNAGGAAYLAHHTPGCCAQEKPDTVVVAAGDLIGASPLLSAAFHDEPTIEAMNLMGLDYASVGNHEFDEGADELLRMQNGGCHPTDGCPTARRSAARSSSTCRPTSFVDRDRRARCSRPTPPRGRGRQGRLHRHDAGGHARHRQPAASPGLTFQDEVDTANALRRRAAGAGRRGDRRAAARGRPADRRRRRQRLPRHHRPDRRHRQAARRRDRRGRLRPHAPGVQLRTDRRQRWSPARLRSGAWSRTST